MTLRISVVIPALNENGRIRQTVESAWTAGAHEVIVVDGGSEDHTLETARACASSVINGPAGRATQQNLGAGHARGDVLLFLHADCRLAHGCCAQVAEAMAGSEAVFGAFEQQIEATGWIYRLLQRGNAARIRWFGVAYGDQGIFVRRDVFTRIGGFPDVAIMEDVSIMKKLRAQGRPVLLPGPVLVSARRWRRHGVIRQTTRNWCLLGGYHLGISPTTLQRYYPRHDTPNGHRPTG